MARTRSTTWRDLVVQANPNHTRESRIVREYEFTTAAHRNVADGVHKDGYRVFEGDYQTRGPYAPETVVTGGITFNGIPVTFDGTPLTFDED